MYSDTDRPTTITKESGRAAKFNIDLNPTGIGQAQQLARQLKEKKLKAVVSSPLIRARHTGKIVAEACGIPLLIRENLHEALTAWRKV